MRVRRAGILLPLFSLPNGVGVGDLGPGARRFLDFLAAGGQSIWQMLPVGVTTPAFGNSPYSGLAAFGLDPMLVSPEDLAEEGLIDASEVTGLSAGSAGRVAWERVRAERDALLARATDTWGRRANRALRADLERFREESGEWAEDLALFLALRDAAGGAAWTTWPEGLRDRAPSSLASARRRHRRRVEHHFRVQVLADRQWRRLKVEAAARGILLVGDLPLYVAHDSLDVWSRRDLFALDEAGASVTVAGVPPDYFSETGQLWGNPTYRWERHADEGYAWWKARMRDLFARFDAVRFDHFRGLSAYWSVPAGAPDARGGRWVPGPGADLLDALVRGLSSFAVIAEDLGTIDAEVRELMQTFELPGMRVLQFAFGDDFPRGEHLPASFDRDVVVYTGTHDNNTVRGWFERETDEALRRRLFAYLGQEVGAAEAPEALLRLGYASRAPWAVVPLQDVFALGAAARINRPGKARGNWTWRARARALGRSQAERLGALASLYARTGGGA